MWADSLCKILIGRWVVLFCLLLCSLTHWLMVCLSGFEPVPGCTTGDVRDGGMGFSWMSDLGTFHCKVRLVISLSVRQTQTDRLTKAHWDIFSGWSELSNLQKFWCHTGTSGLDNSQTCFIYRVTDGLTDWQWLPLVFNLFDVFYFNVRQTEDILTVSQTDLTWHWILVKSAWTVNQWKALSILMLELPCHCACKPCKVWLVF